MKLAYYPGCVSRSTGKEMDISTRSVCKALGIEIEELPDWSCCGATHVPNEQVSIGLAARNIVQTDQPIMTPCSICYSNLRNAVQRLKNPEVLSKVDAALIKASGKGYENRQGAQIKHILEVILEEMKQDDDRIVVPLIGLKVAPYYGCLLTRPSGGIDSPQIPTIMDELARLLKADPVDFALKTFCCGGPIFMPQEEAAAEIVYRILNRAKKAGADVVITVCPLCQLMLDTRQKALEQKNQEKIGIPVLYVTQLVGIALGLGPDELGLSMNSVSPMPIVEKIYEELAKRD
jgi:heterodisulfide reductase subunit B2